MDKVYVRQAERYTVWEATEPVEVNVEKLRKCEPPFEGENEQDLLEYLSDNVWSNEDWADENAEAYLYRGALKIHLNQSGGCNDLQMARNIGYDGADDLYDQYCN